MPKSLVTSVAAACPKCGGSAFEIRLLKDEGVGAAACQSCSRNYLLLDSGDHWFDVIQSGYPRPTRCSCKGTAFALRFDYEYRDDGDVRTVEVRSTCSSCGKARKQMCVEIDYGGTRSLVRTPLKYCRNPKILYDLQALSLYATRPTWPGSSATWGAKRAARFQGGAPRRRSVGAATP